MGETPMNKAFFSSVLCLISLNIASAQYVVKGKVVGYDGQPMIQSDILLLSNETRNPRSVLKGFIADNEGSFLINFNKPRLYRMLFCGVNHKPFELPLYLEQEDTSEISVQLQPIRYKMNVTEITFLTDFDSDSVRYKRKKVELNPDSLFIASFKTKGEYFKYQISGIDEDRHSVNGIQADFFKPDRAGDYYSVLNTNRDSTITITFDPKKLIRSDIPANYKVIRAPTKTTKFFLVHEDYRKRFNDYHNYVVEGRARGITDSDYANNYGWKKDFKELDRMIKEEKDPFLRKAWLLQWLKIAMLDSWAKPNTTVSKKRAQKILEEVEPNSLLWSYHPDAFSVALAKASGTNKQYNEVEKQHLYLKEFGNPFITYVQKAVATHSDSTIRYILLGNAISQAFKFGDYELFEEFYNQYLEEFEGTWHVDRIKSRYSPERIIRPGNHVPEFNFPSVESPNHVLSNKDLLGMNYIINFWATWCGPCKPSLLALTRIYEKFKDEKFKIVSVSLNFRESDLYDYRKNKLPMPWFHTHLEKWKPKQGILKNFEVITIPKNILVDENGIIVDVNGMARENYYEKISNLLIKE